MRAFYLVLLYKLSMSESFSDIIEWGTSVEVGKFIYTEPIFTTIQVKTFNRAGSTETLWLIFYDDNNLFAGGFMVKLKDVPEYNIAWCCQNWKAFPVKLSSENTKIWSITRTEKGLVVFCNDVKVLEEEFESGCDRHFTDSKSWQLYWGRKIAKFAFSSNPLDTASKAFSFPKWGTPVEVGTKYNADFYTASVIQILTVAHAGSRETIRLIFEDNNSDWAGGFIVQFDDVPKYQIAWCYNKWRPFLIELPSNNTRIWSITRTETGLIVYCNDVKLLEERFSDVCDRHFTGSKSWQYYWGRKVATIEFSHDRDTASKAFYIKTSTFDIVDSNGDSSSSGLVIVHKPKEGTFCGSFNQKTGDLICRETGHKCMAHSWNWDEVWEIQATYSIALTQLDCSDDAVSISQCKQAKDDSCGNHRRDRFIKCETDDSIKSKYDDCSVEDCYRIYITADGPIWEPFLDNKTNHGVKLSELNLNNNDNVMDTKFFFETDTIVDHIDVIVSEDAYGVLEEDMLTIEIEVLPAINLDDTTNFRYLEGSKCRFDFKKNSKFPHFIDCQETRYGFLRYDCPKETAAAIKISMSLSVGLYSIHSAKLINMEIRNIGVYGKELKETEQPGHKFVTNNHYEQTLTPPIAATITPEESADNQLELLRSSVPTDIQNADENNYQVVWAPHFEGSISYEVLMSAPTVDTSNEDGTAKTSVLGFLANRGYLDYVLAEEKDVSDKRSKAKVDKTNVVESIKLFQKFNGFPETGEVSKDTIAYIETPRCGVSDIEYSSSKSDQEKDLCFSGIVGGRIMDREADNDCKGLNFDDNREASNMDMCDLMPTLNYNGFIETERSYFIQADIRFKPFGQFTWDSLADNFAIWYNFDESIGETGSGDLIQLYATNSEFGFQYQVLTEGAPVIKQLSNYTLSRVELARREFKIRIDVEEGGVSYLLINGHDTGMLRYFYPMRTAAVVQHRFGVPDLVTARLCKRPDTTTLHNRRRRDQSVSLHKWGSNIITYNFQNYSSHLGEEGTRKAIFQSLHVISQSVHLTFVEKGRHEVVMLTYMFIKGEHADGMTFHGAGLEKAHAFTPVHSEIHFNDWEKFTLEREDDATSMFYVALHETGHALGLRHSDYLDAVMASGYKDNAFDIDDLHRKDKATLKNQYPGEGKGSVEELTLAKRLSALNVPYKPRYPLPRECISLIDAGVLLGSKMYLISNTFVWQYSASGIARLGPPKRLSDVFARWNYATRAAFTVGSRLFLVSDSVVHVYRQFGSVFITDVISTPNEILNSKSSSYKFPPIKAAFTITNPTEGYVTTLVTGEKEYFKLSWKKNKVVKHVERVVDEDGLTLIGKSFGPREFNAAIPYLKKTKFGEAMELYKFDRKFVKRVQIYPRPEDVRSKDQYQEVSKAFNIESWCPPELKS